jgi:hypothetical protein
LPALPKLPALSPTNNNSERKMAPTQAGQMPDDTKWRRLQQRMMEMNMNSSGENSAEFVTGISIEFFDTIKAS